MLTWEHSKGWKRRGSERWRVIRFCILTRFFRLCLDNFMMRSLVYLVVTKICPGVWSLLEDLTDLRSWFMAARSFLESMHFDERRRVKSEKVKERNVLENVREAEWRWQECGWRRTGERKIGKGWHVMGDATANFSNLLLATKAKILTWYLLTKLTENFWLEKFRRKKEEILFLVLARVQAHVEECTQPTRVSIPCGVKTLRSKERWNNTTTTFRKEKMHGAWDLTVLRSFPSFSPSLSC